MLVGSWDGYPLGLIGAASNRTLLRACRVIMEGFRQVMPDRQNKVSMIFLTRMSYFRACQESIDLQDMFQDSGFGSKEEMGAPKLRTGGRQCHLE